MKSKLEKIIDNDLVSEMYNVKSVEWLRYYYYNKASNIHDVVEAQTDIIYFIEDVNHNHEYIVDYFGSNASLHLEKLTKKLKREESNYRLSNSCTGILETVEDKRLSDMFIRKQMVEERKYFNEYSENRKILLVILPEFKELIKKTLESYDK